MQVLSSKINNTQIKESKITNVTEVLAIRTQIAFEMSIALVAYCLKYSAV